MNEKQTILAIDASGLVASVAIAQGDKILAEYSMDYKKTHSETLLPMVDEMIRMTDMDLSTIDAIAVSKGPGSFTGLRIGAATVKGLSAALKKPVIPIPTLEMLAANFLGSDEIIVPMMDARRNQVYTAAYRVENDTVEPVISQRVCDLYEMLSLLRKEIAFPSSFDRKEEKEKNSGVEKVLLEKKAMKRIVFLGDGVDVYKVKIEEWVVKNSPSYAFDDRDIVEPTSYDLQNPTFAYRFAPPHLSRQRAGSLVTLAMKKLRDGEAMKGDAFVPEYLRLSQAEREKNEKS